MPALGTLFLLLGCLVQSQYEGFCLDLLCLVCHVWMLSLGNLLLFEGKWGRVDLEERGDKRNKQDENCDQEIRINF